MLRNAFILTVMLAGVIQQTMQHSSYAINSLCTNFMQINILIRYLLHTQYAVVAIQRRSSKMC